MSLAPPYPPQSPACGHTLTSIAPGAGNGCGLEAIPSFALHFEAECTTDKAASSVDLPLGPAGALFRCVPPPEPRRQLERGVLIAGREIVLPSF